MSYPIIGVCGPAGSGKDTVAGIVAQQLGGQCIALADPMKRLAQLLFYFSEEQLWGPSDKRNAPDPRWAASTPADRMMRGEYVFSRETDAIIKWLSPLVPTEDLNLAHTALQSWYMDTLREANKRDELTPRYVLQTLGTEWGRDFSRDIWVNCAIETAKSILGGSSYSRTSGISAITPDPVPTTVLVTDVRFRNEALAIKATGGEVWRVMPVEVPVTDAAGTAGVVGHRSETELQGIPTSYFSTVVHNDKAAGLYRLGYVLSVYLARRARAQGPQHIHFGDFF